LRPFRRRDVLLVLIALSILPAIIVGRMWKAKSALKGQAAAEPFRIAGNLYYVGATDATAFLLTGTEGHVLLASGYATTAPLILQSVAQLGFDIKDVKFLISSVADDGSAGVLKPLQDASGAALWASDKSADVIASGGYDPNMSQPLKSVFRLGILGYSPPRIDRRFTDGETIRLGSIALTAHRTPGGARDCTSWSFPVRDRDRVLNVVSVCTLVTVMGQRYPEQAADLEQSFRLLRSLPADIWVSAHARAWGRYRKFTESKTAKDPVEPFIDPDGYRDFIDAAESELRRGVVH
jgi:metallo-beta-lactamase class B